MTNCISLLVAGSVLVLAAAAQPASGPAQAPVAAAGEPAATNGVVEGVVQYHGDQQRPWQLSRYYVRNAKVGCLAECVVALEGGGLAASAPVVAPKVYALNQVNFQFVPETTVLRAGDSIQIKNGDEALHNVTTSDGGAPFNLNVTRGQQITRTFEHAGGITEPIRLTCVFHGGMRAWIYVFDHPWFQLTGKDGRFRLENIPPGHYTLGVTHPAGKLRWTREIEIEPNGKTQVDITLTPDDLVGHKPKGN